MSLFSHLELSIIAPAFRRAVGTDHPRAAGAAGSQPRFIFLDLAIAQIAGLGVIIAYSLGWEAGGWQVQLIALGAGLKRRAVIVCQ